jgi:hypothetical protein
MLSFLNIGILVGLVGVSIPVLIHLFAKQKVLRIPFGSVMFIRMFQNQKMRRLRLKQLILLILRCLALLLFVLAFARPSWRVTTAHRSGHAKSTMVCIVDRSLSMRREDLFRKAKEKAARILDLMQGEDECAVIWTSPLVKDPPFFTHHSGILQNVLSETDVTWDKGDLLNTIQLAADGLHSSLNINQEIYLISDFQKTGFSQTADSVWRSGWSGNLFAVPLEGIAENVGIVDAGVENVYFQSKDPIRIFGIIKNYGLKKIENLLVRVFLRGAAVTQKVIQLDPGETQRITFRIHEQNKGWYGGSMQLEDDIFVEDNTRYFNFLIPEKISVLLLGNRLDDTHLIQMVLSSHQGWDDQFVDRTGSGILARLM